MDRETPNTHGTGHKGRANERRRGSITELESTRTQRRRRTATLVTTIAAIITVVGLATSATADTLVSNFAETSFSASNAMKLSLNEFAMSFRTSNNNSSGYQLESVSLDYVTGGTGNFDLVYVDIFTDNGGRPSETNQIAHLSVHATNQYPPTPGLNKYRVRTRRFGGPGITSVHLDTDTQYWVRIFAGEQTTTAELKRVTTPNQSGVAGWTIQNGRLVKPEGTSDANYVTDPDPLKLMVEGTNNPEVLISISDATATEGTDATMDFVVTLNKETTGTVTVEYRTFGDSATSGTDFDETRGTLTFEAGETSKIIAVPIIDDTLNDSGEKFTVRLNNAIGADIDDRIGTGTILNTEILTASFENVPAEHDGSTAFTFNAAFTTDIAIGYAAMRDQAFTVMKGEVTKARRVDGRSDRWEITVDPDGNDAVTVTLPNNRACGTQGAICSKEDNPVQLSNSPSATIAGPPAEPVGAPLTASFSNVPDDHNGSDFTFQLTFSEEPDAGWRDVKGAVRVSKGSVNGTSRKTQGSNLAWKVKVRPSGTGSLTITLPETTDCSDSNAICTANGRKLSHSTSQRVQGLVGISIADGEVEEAAGARVVFRVSLSEAASQRMTVDWATSDGTAQAGSDYQNTTGSLTFLKGHTSRDVDIQVYDDEHNEGSETFTVTLSNASTGQITDATATGTITNHDALPAALTARFGRTAAVHIVEQVEERVNAPRTPGLAGRVAGREINGDMGQQFALDFLQPIGSRFVGTPRAGMRTSEYGRDYRIGYGMQVLEQGKLNLELGIDAERRESPVFQLQEQAGGTDQRVLGRATVQW